MCARVRLWLIPLFTRPFIVGMNCYWNWISFRCFVCVRRAYFCIYNRRFVGDLRWSTLLPNTDIIISHCNIIQISHELQTCSFLDVTANVHAIAEDTSHTATHTSMYNCLWCGQVPSFFFRIDALDCCRLFVVCIAHTLRVCFHGWWYIFHICMWLIVCRMPIGYLLHFKLISIAITV